MCQPLYAMIQKYVRIHEENQLDTANLNADVSFFALRTDAIL